MPSVPFIKMHGLGNDFIVIDRRKTPVDPTAQELRLMADRRFGIGCDQIVYLDPPEGDGADAFMRIRNADGSMAETCGNASRCLASLLMKETGKDTITLETVVGPLYCQRDGEHVTVDMGPPRLEWEQIPLAEQMDTAHLDLTMGPISDPVAVSMGNPHVVFFVRLLDGFPIDKLGPQIETHPLFPKKTNVEFVQILGPQTLRMRVWERGAGVTSACGTGACATLVAAVRRGHVAKGARCEVILDGGSLWITWDGKGSVMMTGPAVLAFEGVWHN